MHRRISNKELVIFILNNNAMEELDEIDSANKKRATRHERIFLGLLQVYCKNSNNVPNYFANVKAEL